MNWNNGVSVTVNGSGYTVTTGTVGSWMGRNAGSPDGYEHGNGFICRNGTPDGNPTTMQPTPSCGQMDIRDGTSNSIAIGETIPQFCPWSVWYWFDGATATGGLPLNYRLYMVPYGSRANKGTNAYLYNCGFMSRHPGGGNFGMCDASVRFMSEAINSTYVTVNTANSKTPYGFTLLEALATVDGGENAQPP